MISKLAPKYSFTSYKEISPGFLHRLGIRFLMIDLDNTLAKYSEHAPSVSTARWVDDMKANNIDLYFISNSKRENRVDNFAYELDIPFTKNAEKPNPDSLYRAIRDSGYKISESAFLGDQVFTDTLAANRAGVISIIVRPLSLKNPLLLLRYLAEIPFRTICAIKRRKMKVQINE